MLTNASEVAEYIRAARTQSGLTLEEAALATGIARSTLQVIETDPSTVGFDTVLRVARELGVTFFAFPSGQQEQVIRLTAPLCDRGPGHCQPR